MVPSKRIEAPFYIFKKNVYLFALDGVRPTSVWNGTRQQQLKYKKNLFASPKYHTKSPLMNDDGHV